MTNKDAEMVKGLTLANEFLKIIRDFKLEETRVDPFPHEVGEVLANAHLDTLMETKEMDPEHLVWGLVHIIEIILKIQGKTAEELTVAIDDYISRIPKDTDGQE